MGFNFTFCQVNCYGVIQKYLEPADEAVAIFIDALLRLSDRV